jgi:hypothetical protein
MESTCILPSASEHCGEVPGALHARIIPAPGQGLIRKASSMRRTALGLVAVVVGLAYSAADVEAWPRHRSRCWAPTPCCQAPAPEVAPAPQGADCAPYSLYYCESGKWVLQAQSQNLKWLWQKAEFSDREWVEVEADPATFQNCKDPADHPGAKGFTIWPRLSKSGPPPIIRLYDLYFCINAHWSFGGTYNTSQDATNAASPLPVGATDFKVMGVPNGCNTRMCNACTQ